MIFVIVDDVNLILGDDWTTQDKKALAVNQANVWLSSKRFCKGLSPIDESLKQAGAQLALLSSKGLLYQTRDEGVVSESTVKADTVQVTEKYVVGQEQGKSSEIQFIDDLIKPFLCGGVGNINTRVCK